MSDDDDELRCPKCGSHHIHAERRGFATKRSIVLGAAGAITLVGALPMFLASGFIGKNNIWLTCLQCGHRSRPGGVDFRSRLSRLTDNPQASPFFVVGAPVRRTPNGVLGEVAGIDGDAVTVRWPNNRTSIHLSRDLKLVRVGSALPDATAVPHVGSRVRRTLNGPIGEVIAVDRDAITVRWPNNRSSTHLRRDLKPI